MGRLFTYDILKITLGVPLHPKAKRSSMHFSNRVSSSGLTRYFTMAWKATTVSALAGLLFPAIIGHTQPLQTDDKAAAASTSVLKKLLRDPVSMLDWGLYKAQLDLQAKLADLNKRLHNHMFGPKWEERERNLLSGSGRDKGYIEARILASAKRREEMLQNEKKNPLTSFVPSGENFNFDDVRVRYSFSEDLVDIDFMTSLVVDLDQVDLSSSINYADQWITKKINPSMCVHLMHDLKGFTGEFFWAFKMEEWFGHNRFKRGEINEKTFDSEIADRIRINAYLYASNFEKHQVKCTTYLKEGWSRSKGKLSIEVTEDAWGAFKK